MSALERIKEYLDQHGVAYVSHHHDPSYTAMEVARAEGVPGQLVAKVVIAFADDRPAMLVLPASRHVDEDKAAKALGANALRLATEDEFASYFPDAEVGAMPPFGNLYGIDVYVDTSLSEDRTIYFQGGSHTEIFAVEYEDYARLVEPMMVDIARPNIDTPA